MNYKNMIARTMLKENLIQLNKQQLKLFYGVLVHAWASQKAFISDQNLHNLWCELNYHCVEEDEGFPDPYDDHELLISYCHAHPYYFIDILTLELVINLFCRYLEDRLDDLATVVNMLRTEGLRAAYGSLKEAIGLTEDVDELSCEIEEHIKTFS